MAEKSFARRAGHRAEAQKLCLRIGDLVKVVNSDCDKLRTYKCELTKQFNKITQLDDELEDNIPLSKLEDEISDVSAWSMEIEEAIFQAEKYLKRKNEELQEITQSNYVRNVKLPTIELPKFNGSFLDWQNFWDLYETSVHKRTDLGNASKFHYLVSQLTGEAAKLMVGFNYTDAEYNEAVELLKTTYGKPSYLVDAHLNAIIDLPSPGPTGQELSIFRSSYEGHLRAMKSLNTNVDAAGFVFAAILLRKIPSSIRDNMNREGRKDNWELESLRKAIETEISHLKAFEPATFVQKQEVNSMYYDDNTSRYKSATILTTTENSNGVAVRTCHLCKSPKHSAFQCDKYISVQQRRDQVKNMRLCYNCLRKGHVSKECKSLTNCRKCHKRHHTAVCDADLNFKDSKYIRKDYSKYGHNNNYNDSRTTQNSISVEQGSSSVNHSTAEDGINRYSSPVILPTAMVNISNDSGESIVKVRALIDIGSQRTFIIKDMLQKCSYKNKRDINLSIRGFCSKIEHKNYKVVALNIFVNGEVIPIEAVVIDSLPDNISMPGRSNLVKELIGEGIKLADPDISTNSFNISLLIGADQYSKFVYSNTVQKVTLIPSKFGSLLAGPINNTYTDEVENISVESVTVLKIVTNEDLNCQLEEFWKINSVDESAETNDEFDQFKNCVRYENNHFIASLPWKPFHPELPINYNLCVRRLDSLLKSLRKDSNMLEQYDKVINDQLNSKFIEKVDISERVTGKLHYIPHHCVIKSSSTTPVRIVFDCSSKSKKELPSLNDCLFSGPVLINEMISVLLRFRAFKYACVSDIMKAFLMVELEENDRNVTRFLWPENPNDPNSKMVVYRFRVVLFGATCSQFLLNISIKVHLEQYQNKLIRDLERSLYVDNVIHSVNSKDELIKFFHVSNSTLNKANFKLRSWASNCNELNAIIPEEIKCRDMAENKNIDVLGLSWNCNSDILSFKCYNIEAHLNNVTKRYIVSECSKIYDPLGILLPVTISSRILIQDVWKLKSGWDVVVDDSILVRWNALIRDLNSCQTIKIPRALHLNIVEICCFSDASIKAYGAVIYVKCDSNINFFIAKARVAPVKTVSLPHLELLGAHTAAKLAAYAICTLTDICIIKSVSIWSDSQIVLSWMRASKFNKNYVQKRIIDIKNLVPNAVWNFVEGNSNPADCLTRGISADEFHKNKLWLNGPIWLPDKSKWPELFIPPVIESEIATVSILKENCRVIDESKVNLETMLKRFNCFDKLINTIAYVLKFIENIRRKINNKEKCDITLSPNDLFIAESTIIAAVQRVYFYEVFDYFENIKNNIVIPNIVRQLNLFIENSIIKCKGRLCNSNLDINAKFPILIPYDSYLSVLIINYFHKITMHGGVNNVLSAIRENYWIARGRQRVKTEIGKCVICKRHHGRVISAPDVSPYPKFRVEDNLPFTYTGVDYAGPLNVKICNQIAKVYICLFTCMTTRAIHLELAEDMTGETFIHAFRRFVSRRSCPSVMLSDNAGNFKYGSDYLFNLYKIEKVKDSLNKFKVEWKFIPSRAPHFGGTWERLIGLTKLCLKKVLGTKLISNTEMVTLLCEVECQLNNRPLTHISGNVQENALTPSHLLCGRNLNSIAFKGLEVDELYDPSYNNSDNVFLTKRNIILKSLLEHFWLRWKEEYLKSLRERDRSLIGKEFNLKVGNIVLVSDNTPRSTWRLGKIIELYMGSDGNIRSVKLKTATGIITRPVIKLVNLEILSKDCPVIKLTNSEENCTADTSRPPKRVAAIKASLNIKNMF